jgi:hypothetical protein
MGNPEVELVFYQNWYHLVSMLHLAASVLAWTPTLIVLVKATSTVF